MPTTTLLHYCGHPDSRWEPTLCGLARYDSGVVEADNGKTTTRVADVTCPACVEILEKG